MLTSACKSGEKLLIVACLISPVILFIGHSISLENSIKNIEVGEKYSAAPLSTLFSVFHFTKKHSVSCLINYQNNS